MQRAESACGHYYIIRRGETLSEIAERSGITLEELLQMNPYLNPAYHLVGQTILLPNKVEEEVFAYRIKKGEKLSDILIRYENSVADIRILNPGLDVFNLKAEQEILLRKPAKKQDSQKREP